MHKATVDSGMQLPTPGVDVYERTDAECEQSVLETLRIGYRQIDTATSHGYGEAPLKRAVPATAH